jgi:hypothetical protein
LTTPKLLLPELVVGQAGKELTHNQALAILDQLTQPVVVDKDLAAPPGSPANGSMYIVAASATGLWVGQSGKLAVWLTTVAAWTFITPVDGWGVWVSDEAARYERRLGAWVYAGVITTDSGFIGYGTGSGGTVTQATSKTTGVTLNKPTGAVTLNSEALAAGAVVSFTLTNNKISSADVPSVAIKDGSTAGAYTMTVDAVATGSCRVSLRNQSAGSLSEAVVLSFALVKGAIA